jgi:hypothetical protein
MTARSDRHGELALAWPDDSGRGARARLLAGGEPVLDVILGEERANPRAQFIRRGGEDQTWRVLGSVLVDIEPRRWVEAELLAIPDGEVRAVTVNGLHLAGEEGADGKVEFKVIDSSPLVAPTEFDWTPTRRSTALRTLPSWLSRLELEDVRKAKSGPEAGAADPAISPEFDMVRGTLKVNAVREGDAVWISFAAKPKDGAPSAAEINAKKKYPGDPYVPDWTEFAAKHAGDAPHLLDPSFLAMTLGVLALFAEGPTTLRNIASSRVKETDRIHAMATELAKLGARVESGPDYLRVAAPAALVPGAAIDTYDDHRIAMCFSLAALGGVPVRINDPDCVAKTFPDYFDVFASIAR